jgi:hypothetical protein
MAPQLTAIKGLCFRAEREWMMCEKTSLPTPLSPFINTLKSVFATCIATSSAYTSAGELPIIPNLFFIAC